jgi:hypothetical protein
MPLALREVRVLKQGREVNGIPPYLVSLDLDDHITTRDVLTRHIYAVADRARVDRRQSHLFTLDVYDVHQGKGFGRPLYRWALPVECMP